VGFGEKEEHFSSSIERVLKLEMSGGESQVQVHNYEINRNKI
jgi:hypothetical protein